LRKKKNFWDMTFCQNCCKKIFSLFHLASSEIIGVKFHNRQTDRVTNYLTPYTDGFVFFLQSKFFTSLLALLAGDNLFHHNITLHFRNNHIVIYYG
jgi:hypothetical protein